MIYCSIVNIHLTMVIYTNIIPAFDDLLTPGLSRIQILQMLEASIVIFVLAEWNTKHAFYILSLTSIIQRRCLCVLSMFMLSILNVNINCTSFLIGLSSRSKEQDSTNRINTIIFLIVSVPSHTLHYCPSVIRAGRVIQVVGYIDDHYCFNDW